MSEAQIQLAEQFLKTAEKDKAAGRYSAISADYLATLCRVLDSDAQHATNLAWAKALGVEYNGSHVESAQMAIELALARATKEAFDIAIDLSIKWTAYKAQRKALLNHPLYLAACETLEGK